MAYFSPNGRTWQFAATIDPAGGWTPSLVKGSDDGFVVAGTSAAGQIVAYTSTGTGGTWLPTAPRSRVLRQSSYSARPASAGATGESPG